MKLTIRQRIKDILCHWLFGSLCSLEYFLDDLAALTPRYSGRETLIYLIQALFSAFSNWLYVGSAEECQFAIDYTHDEIPDHAFSPRALNARYGREG